MTCVIVINSPDHVLTGVSKYSSGIRISSEWKVKTPTFACAFFTTFSCWHFFLAISHVLTVSPEKVFAGFSLDAFSCLHFCFSEKSDWQQCSSSMDWHWIDFLDLIPQKKHSARLSIWNVGSLSFESDPRECAAALDKSKHKIERPNRKIRARQSKFQMRLFLIPEAIESIVTARQHQNCAMRSQTGTSGSSTLCTFLSSASGRQRKDRTLFNLASATTFIATQMPDN